MEFDALIALPLKEEFEYAHAALRERYGGLSSIFADQRYFGFKLKSGKQAVAAAIGGMGNVRAAAATAAFVSRFRPKVAVMVGMAGALDSKLGLGDVVFAERVKSRSFNKIKELATADEVVQNAIPVPQAQAPVGGVAYPRELDCREKILGRSYLRSIRDTAGHVPTQPYLTGFKPSTPLLGVDDAIVPSALRNAKPLCHHKCMFSWDLVVDSDECVDYITETNHNYYFDHFPTDFDGRPAQFDGDKVATVDMETYGFFSVLRELAAQQRDVTYAASFRGITDFAKQRKSIPRDADALIREKATRNAMNVALDFVESLKL
jgi:nucleoside phosphorylase